MLRVRNKVPPFEHASKIADNASHPSAIGSLSPRAYEVSVYP